MNKETEENFMREDTLIIIGASGHGKVVADIAIKMDKWNHIKFLDDNEKLKYVMNIEVIGKVKDAVFFKETASFFVGIGNNEFRHNIQEKLLKGGYKLTTLIHPHSSVGLGVKIGIGTCIMSGAVINCDTKIERGCIINTNVSIDHDNILKSYVHVSPGVVTAGNVTVGNVSWLGVGSKVINNINICGKCKIGAGTTIINDINEAGTYVGTPARRIN